MHDRFKVLAFLFAATALAGCSELASGPTVAKSNGSIRTVNAHLQYAASTILGKHLTPYYCSIVSLAKDGRYKKTTLWLKVPQSMRASNGTAQNMRFEWRLDDKGSPQAGAFCRIPNTPAAVDHLLAKVLFIDPKTMKGNATTTGHSASLMANETYQLSPVVVYATTEWTADMETSSFSYYNDMSVPSWNDTQQSEYVGPGSSCDDPGNPDVAGLVISAASSELVQDPYQECELAKAGGAPQYCIDIYIAACSVNSLAGDCREADPNAPASASRAQIIFGQTQGSFEPFVTVHETCITHTALCTAPLGSPGNTVRIAYPSPDTIAVTFHFTNSMTTLGGTIGGTPSIDGSMVFVRNSYGIFYPAPGSRDAFPSMSVYYFDPYVGSIQLLQRDEQSFYNLIDHLGWTDNWTLCIPQ